MESKGAKILMRKLIVASMMLALALPCAANDSAIDGVGGRPQRMTGEHPTIAMTSENVQIWMKPGKTYTVQADFVFRNAGKATTVKMGFPEGGYGDVPGQTKRTAFTSFATSVDGQNFKAVRQITRNNPNGDSFQAFWVKSVPFRANQTRKIRVRYSAPYGSNTESEDYATYDLTGKNWRGSVAKTVLTVHVERPGTFLMRSFSEKKPVFRRDGHDFIYNWTNWQAEDAFTFVLRPTLRNWLAYADTNPIKENQALPINIDIKGQKPSETGIAYIPAGVVKDGQTWLNLRDWAEKSGAKVVYNAATKKTMVSFGGKQMLVGNDAMQVKGRFQNATFVPAKTLERELGARFSVDLPSHTLKTVQ